MTAAAIIAVLALLALALLASIGANLCQARDRRALADQVRWHATELGHADTRIDEYRHHFGPLPGDELVGDTTVPSSRRANREEVAAFFGVPPEAVDVWVARGCPTIEDRGQFDILRVAEWRFSAAGVTEGAA